MPTPSVADSVGNQGVFGQLKLLSLSLLQASNFLSFGELEVSVNLEARYSITAKINSYDFSVMHKSTTATVRKWGSPCKQITASCSKSLTRIISMGNQEACSTWPLHAWLVPGKHFQGSKVAHPHKPGSQHTVFGTGITNYYWAFLIWVELIPTQSLLTKRAT